MNVGFLVFHVHVSNNLVHKILLFKWIFLLKIHCCCFCVVVVATFQPFSIDICMYFIMGFLSGGGREAEDEWICICSRIFKISALWLVVEIPSFNFTKINKNIPPPRNPKQSDEYSTLLYSHRKIQSITIRTFSIFFIFFTGILLMYVCWTVLGGELCVLSLLY